MKDNNVKNNKKEEAPMPPETEEKITITKKEYEALKAGSEEGASFQDKYLRAHAEFENARKRIEKDKLEFLKYANESMILEFLSILDNLEIAEKHIKEAKDFKAVRDGVDMIQSQMQKFLKDIGLERIKTAGEKFDPHIHEAMDVENADNKEDSSITAELKPGYRFNGKLLRPAMVRIVKKVQ